MPPSSTITMESTIAKIGRVMKKWATIYALIATFWPGRTFCVP
jgi:hypothetical protein